MLRFTTLCRGRVAQLTPEQVTSAMQALPGWAPRTLSNQKEVIVKEYVFADFKTAWKFMASLYTFIDESDHHPEWANVYNRVRVTLTTHDADNKISIKDIKLAEQMEIAASKLAQ